VTVAIPRLLGGSGKMSQYLSPYMSRKSVPTAEKPGGGLSSGLCLVRGFQRPIVPMAEYRTRLDRGESVPDSGGLVSVDEAGN
jgi:hypothetical protein